jgi:hypothetical protein
MKTSLPQSVVFISKAFWLVWVMGTEFIDLVISIIWFTLVIHPLFSHFRFCNFFNDDVQLFRLQYVRSYSIIERVTKLNVDGFMGGYPISVVLINFNLINDGKVVNIERKSIVYGQSHNIRVWILLSGVWDTSSSMLVL